MTIEVTPFVIALIYVAYALPVIPIALAWRGVIMRLPVRWTFVALLIVTLSYLWFLAILAFGSTIAPDYSDLRFRTINGNAIAMLLAIILVVIGRQLRWQIITSSCLLLLLWSYLAAVSSVV